MVFVEQNLPDGKSNKGRVQAMMALSTLRTLRCSLKPLSRSGHQRSVSTNRRTVPGGAESVRAQHSLIHRYWHDTTVQMSISKTRVWLLPVPGPIRPTP